MYDDVTYVHDDVTYVYALFSHYTWEASSFKVQEFRLSGLVSLWGYVYDDVTYVHDDVTYVYFLGFRV